MRPLIALLIVAAFAAVPLVYAQQATPSPSPSAAATPEKKHRKKVPPAGAAATATPAGQTTTAASPAPSAPKKAAKALPTPLATQAAGGGNGLVWVNSDSHVYHKEGSKWYGRTKHGKYETEQDAIKEGNHASKNEKQ